MPKMLSKVNPQKTAIIVVDMSNDFVAPGAPVYSDMGNKLAPALNDFLNQCREKDIMVIYTTHEYRADGSDMGKYSKLMTQQSGGLIAGTPGVEIYPVCAPKEGEPIIHKHFYNAFYGTDLDIILRSSGIETVLITGVCTDVCCFATARDALFHGYDVVYISDLNGTVSFPDIGYGSFTAEEHHRMALNNIWDCNGDVMTSQEFLSLMAN